MLLRHWSTMKNLSDSGKKAGKTNLAIFTLHIWLLEEHIVNWNNTPNPVMPTQKAMQFKNPTSFFAAANALAVIYLAGQNPDSAQYFIHLVRNYPGEERLKELHVGEELKGDIQLQKGLLDSALYHYIQSQEVRLASKSSRQKPDDFARGYQKIGSIYLKQEQWELALEQFKMGMCHLAGKASHGQLEDYRICRCYPLSL